MGLAKGNSGGRPTGVLAFVGFFAVLKVSVTIYETLCREPFAWAAVDLASSFPEEGVAQHA